MAIGGNTTTYRVETVYTVDDKVSRALAGIESAANRTARSTGGLGRTFGVLTGVLAGGRLLGGAKSALIDFNSNLEQAGIQMGLIASLNTGTTVAAQMGQATDALGKYQRMAKDSALTTKDLVDMNAMIERPLRIAGAQGAKLQRMVFGAANASKAFGLRSDVGALDIEQMLQGTVTGKDRMAQQLLAAQKLTREKFNQLSAAKRLAIVEKALTDPRIVEAAKMQADTWEGVTSTFKDNLSMALGKVGLPLMKALTKEVKGWNTWLDANQHKVNQLAESLAKNLVAGFRAVKDAVSFLVTHADKIIAIGKVWLAAKAGQAVAGLAGAGASAFGQLGSKVGGKGKGSMGWMDAAGPLAAVGVGAYMLGGELDKATGLSSALGTGLAKLTGRYDDESEAIDRKLATMKRYESALEASVAKAQNDNKTGSVAVGNARGSAGHTAEQLAVLKRIAEAKDFVSAGLARAQGLGLGMDESMLAGGIAADALRAIEAKRLEAKFSKQGAKAYGDPIAAQSMFLGSLGGLTKAQRMALDVDSAMAEWVDVYQNRMNKLSAATALLRTVNPQGVLDFTRAVMDLADPMGAVKRLQEQNAKKNMARPSNTNINIAKVEVAAKDPDRWIQDLDRKVDRQVRARRSANSGRRGGS